MPYTIGLYAMCLFITFKIILLCLIIKLLNIQHEGDPFPFARKGIEIKTSRQCDAYMCQ